MVEGCDTEVKEQCASPSAVSITGSNLGDTQLKARLEDSCTRYDAAQPLSTEPDGGYGWVCVACMLLIIANTWGVNGVSSSRSSAAVSSLKFSRSRI